MEQICHPVSGEVGFFATKLEKTLIDIAFVNFNQQFILPPREEGGVDLD